MARKPKRDDELAGKTKKLDEKLGDVLKSVKKGFNDQLGRANELADNWDMYNCVLTDAQFYNGESRIYLPFVRDAVEAINTRYINQLFPQSGRFVEAISTSPDLPREWMSLLEHYVRARKLRTEIVPALIRNGQLEGQYSLYIDWGETVRNTVEKVRKPVTSDGMENPAAGEVDDVEEHEITDAAPLVETIADADLLVLPGTVDSIEEALEVGGSVTVVRRWSKAKIQAMADEGKIIGSEADALIEYLEGVNSKTQHKDTEKDNAEAAGIGKPRGKHAVVYETWTRVSVPGWKGKRLVRVYYGGENQILGAKLCPFWNDRCPVISVPVVKVAGVFKGQAPATAVQSLQVFANDTINEGADTAHYSAAPIIMTDPDKNPRVGSMILSIGALWETSPQDTQIVKFPELWESCVQRAKEIQQQIFQTMGVTPAMIPQSTGGKGKRNQAEMAMEQQVDLLNVADAATVLEEGILTPTVQRFAEYDAQFRDDDVTIPAFGDMGLRAVMQTVGPIQMGNSLEFRWFGLESARNAQQVQQQISLLNVAQGIDPTKYKGYRLNMAPALVVAFESAFGPRLGSMVFEKEVMISVDPEVENQMMEHGMRAAVHMGDDDMQHMQVHVQLLQQMGGVDPHGCLKEHIQQHQQQMQNKVQAMAAQQGPGGPGAPGPHGPPGGGGPGQPQPGATPQGPHAAKGPPGMVHPDQMGAHGAVTHPRKM